MTRRAYRPLALNRGRHTAVSIMSSRRQLMETTAATAARDAEVFGDLIRGTGHLLAGYTDDQLLVIRDFLDRVRQLTTAHADALAGHAGSRAGNAKATRPGRG